MLLFYQKQPTFSVPSKDFLQENYQIDSSQIDNIPLIADYLPDLETYASSNKRKDHAWIAAPLSLDLRIVAKEGDEKSKKFHIDQLVKHYQARLDLLEERGVSQKPANVPPTQKKSLFSRLFG